MSEKIPDFTEAEEEAADALHRLLDYCHARQLKVGEALVAKIKYNATRADHQLENRRKKGGKHF